MKTRGICLYKERYLHLQCQPSTSNCVSLLTVLVWLSALADDGFPVVAGDVVEPHPVVVEVVENSNTELVTLPVVWLTSASTGDKIIKMRQYLISVSSHPPVWDQLTLL